MRFVKLSFPPRRNKKGTCYVTEKVRDVLPVLPYVTEKVRDVLPVLPYVTEKVRDVLPVLPYVTEKVRDVTLNERSPTTQGQRFSRGRIDRT